MARGIGETWRNEGGHSGPALPAGCRRVIPRV